MLARFLACCLACRNHTDVLPAELLSRLLRMRLGTVEDEPFRPVHCALRLHTVTHVRHLRQDITLGICRVSTRGVRQSGSHVHIYIHIYIDIYMDIYIYREREVNTSAVPRSDRWFANRHMRADVRDIEAMWTYAFLDQVRGIDCFSSDALPGLQKVTRAVMTPPCLPFQEHGIKESSLTW